jgi:hypothetical protein
VAIGSIRDPEIQDFIRQAGNDQRSINGARIFGGDAVGRGQTGSPGSDGASPYPELRPASAGTSGANLPLQVSAYWFVSCQSEKGV